MSRHLHDPRQHSVVTLDRLVLGSLFLLELYRRLKCGICGPAELPDRRLSGPVQLVDPGYCLDAPTTMPAGGMGSFMLQDHPDALPEMLLCSREP